MIDNGYGAGLGIGVILVLIVTYLGVLALMLWVGYLIMRTAVKNGILKADEVRAQRYGPPRPPYQPPAQPPSL